MASNHRRNILLLGLFDSLILAVVWGLHPLIGLTAVLDWLVTIALGVIFIFALSDKGGLNENAESAPQRSNIRLRLAKLQRPLGLVAIVLGIWDYVLDALKVMWY